MKKRLSTAEEKVRQWYKKEEGLEVFQITLPRFLIRDRDTGEFFFSEPKKVGERLSEQERLSFKLLQEVGLKVEIAILTEKGTVVRSLFDSKDVRFHIPKRVFFTAPHAPISRGRKQEEDFKLRVEPYDPLKHRLSPEERLSLERVMDEEQEREYKELLEMLPKPREVKPREVEQKGEEMLSTFLLEEEEVLS
jgi:hypothetical protein